VLQEDFGEIRVSGESVLYHQPYCIVSNTSFLTPPYTEKNLYYFEGLAVNPQLEEIFILKDGKFELLCRSSNPMAIVGDFLYHCPDEFSDSEDSESDELANELGFGV
jgi:hypothetical protein